MNREQLKRLAIIVGFALLVLGVLIVIWFLFFQPFIRLTNTNENTNTAANTNGQLPNSNVNRPVNTNNPTAVGLTTLPKPSEVANGDFTLVTDLATQTTVAATIAADGRNVVYYNDLDGSFVRIDPSTGTLTKVSTQQFPDVQKVTWAPDAQRAVLEFPDDSKVVYDFGKQKQYTLPKQAQEFSFSADSTGLAYEFVGSGVDETFLVVANADGTSSKAVAKLGDKTTEVQVAWSPSDEVVGFFRKGTGADSQEIVLIGQNQENFKTLPIDGRGFKGKWTPDGNRVLYTTYSEASNWNPELHLRSREANRSGRVISIWVYRPLDKCAFSPTGTHAYRAVPDYLESGSGLYPEFSANVKDTIYTINLQTGNALPLAMPVTGSYERFGISSLFVSSDETTLFFTDQATRRLHKVRLK